MFELSRDVLSGEPLHVAVAGVGGTGSEVISGLINLHHALVAFGYGGIRVSAFDPDTVSPANIVRQRYTQADLGRAKATTLINRVNLASGFDWLHGGPCTRPHSPTGFASGSFGSISAMTKRPAKRSSGRPATARRRSCTCCRARRNYIPN